MINLLSRGLSDLHNRLLRHLFVLKHLKKIRTKNLSEIISDPLYCSALYESLPPGSKSQKILACILWCSNLLDNKCFDTVNWDSFYTMVPSQSWRILILHEARKFLSDSNTELLTEKLKHLRYDCFKNLEVHYDYIIFLSEIRRRTPRSKEIFEKLFPYKFNPKLAFCNPNGDISSSFQNVPRESSHSNFVRTNPNINSN